MATRREDLEQLRDALWGSLSAETEPQAVASVSKEIRALWAELDGLPVPLSQAPADQIAARREARRSQATGG